MKHVVVEHRLHMLRDHAGRYVRIISASFFIKPPPKKRTATLIVSFPNYLYIDCRTRVLRVPYRSQKYRQILGNTSAYQLEI